MSLAGGYCVGKMRWVSLAERRPPINRDVTLKTEGRAVIGGRRLGLNRWRYDIGGCPGDTPESRGMGAVTHWWEELKECGCCAVDREGP